MFGLIGCGGGGSSEDITDRFPDPTVFFINSVPDVNQLAFKINDLQLVPNLGYLNTNADFLTIARDKEEDGGTDYSIENGTTGEEFERDNRTFEKDTDSLILAFGLANPGTEITKKIQQFVIQVNRRVVAGKCRLLIFNALIQPAGVDGRSINFRDVDPADPDTLVNPLFGKDNLQFGTFANDASILDVDPGTRTFQARASDSDAVEIFCQRTITLRSNTIMLALVTGRVDSNDANLQPRIEFINISTKL